MRSPMAKVAIIGGLLAVVTLALVLYAALSSAQLTCEVCMTYLGRTQCREASGRTEKEATRTAIDNACAFLASGMTQTVACTTTTAPDSVQCLGSTLD